MLLFEDIKGVITSRKVKKDRQCNEKKHQQQKHKQWSTQKN